ncbi:unnamed protein product [Calicophoron daubneyi]|uniref:Potassium channel domain-containing protein n=1 Tax=Calicophoron daubneyi TaxID=300641 RepID=A0AAV2T2J0_CALDB
MSGSALAQFESLMGSLYFSSHAESNLPRVTTAKILGIVNKTKTSLAALVNPVTQLIQMVTSNFLYPADIPNPNAATIISNPSAASVHDFPQYAPGSGPTLMRDGTMLESTSQGPANHLMTIATVEGQGSMQPGLISTVIPNQMAGFPVDSSANLTAVSPYATINSSAAMNIPQLENLQNRRAEKPRYFTFEGQHRKFYLAARYLRSSQRQRRHNRRIKQRLKEQSRAEMNLLQNALSYGQIAANRRRTIDERTEVAESTQEQDSDILSLESEVPEEIRPQLICWKDIDLDLEVRSIEDEHELASIDQKEVRNADLFTEPCFPIQRKPTTKIRTKDLRLRRKARNRIQPIETGKTQTEDSARWVSECTDLHGLDFKCSHEEEYRSSTLKPQLPQDKGASQTKQSVQNHIPCAIPTTIKTKSPTTLQPTIYCNYMTLPFENSEHTLMNRITANHFTRPTPSGKHKPTVQLSPGSTYSKVTQKVPTEQLQNKLNTTPSTEQIPLHPLTPKTLTLPVMGTKDVRNVPLKMTQSLQNDNVKSLLQSTVISNPMALDGFKSESMEKEMAQGKSRLSIASSRGDLSSELHVQLSYYSQPDEAATEEDLSFFSFRDGFSSEEDFSKVTVPISLSLLIMTTYILIGTAVFCKWEDVNYLKWSYFCFITLSTIGFGTKIDSENTKEKFVFITVYLAIGLIVFAMCFKLMQEEVVEKAKWFARKVGIIKEKEKKTEKSL